jgi:hypothetical protein
MLLESHKMTSIVEEMRMIGLFCDKAVRGALLSACVPTSALSWTLNLFLDVFLLLCAWFVVILTEQNKTEQRTEKEREQRRRR